MTRRTFPSPLHSAPPHPSRSPRDITFASLHRSLSLCRIVLYVGQSTATMQFPQLSTTTFNVKPTVWRSNSSLNVIAHRISHNFTSISLHRQQSGLHLLRHPTLRCSVRSEQPLEQLMEEDHALLPPRINESLVFSSLAQSSAVCYDVVAKKIRQ